MSARDPLPDQHVPDVVLEELLAAFATPAAGDTGEPQDTGVPRNTGDAAYDFDDPSIDRLLGIDTEELGRRIHVAEEPVAPPADAGSPTTSATARLDTPATRRARRAESRATRSAGGASATTSSGETTVGLRPGTARAASPTGRAPTVGDPLAAAAVPAGAKLGRKQRKAARLAGVATAVPADASPMPAGGRRTIVIADDDQHMDPIYLDEDAGQRMREVHAGPSGRATIVIDEFEQHTDAVSALAASSTRIDPRLRARRVAVRRAVGRRRLIWAGIIAAVVLVAVAVVAVLASSLFDVRTIDTQGNVYTDATLIQRVQQEMRGEPILLVDTKKLEHELEAGPWIESARVSTDFPHRVLIDIRERAPQATFAGSDGRYRVIDRDGRVLAVLDGRPVAYMLLTGPAPDSEPGQFAGAAYAAAAQFVIALPAEVRAITTSIAVDTTTNEMTLAIDAPNATGVTARVGTVNGIEDKLARLLRFVQDGLKPDQHLDVSTVQVGS